MTGHTEAVLVVFDPEQVSLDDPGRVLGEPRPDPVRRAGQRHRQSVPVGHLHQLRRAARRGRGQPRPVPGKLDEAGYGTITTEVAPAGEFFYAEDYHQQYLAANPRGYCNHGFCQVAA